MNSKQVKKILSITLATAMIATGVPTGPLAVSAESESQETAEDASTEETVNPEKDAAEETAADTEEGAESEEPAKADETGEPKVDSSAVSAEAEAEKKETSGEKETSETKEQNKSEEASDAEKDPEVIGGENTGETDEITSAEGGYIGFDQQQFTWTPGVQQAPVIVGTSVDLYYVYRRLGEFEKIEKPEEPGEYGVSAYRKDTGDIFDSTKFTIKKRDAEVKWNSEMSYTGKEITVPELSISLFDGIVTRTVEVTEGDLTDGKIKNAGTYALKADLSDLAAHYTFNGQEYYENMTFPFKVTPKEVTVKWNDTEETTFTYDGEPHKLATPTIEGDDSGATVKYMQEDGEKDPINAGTYTATVSISSNYTITSGATKTMTINPRKVNVVLDNNGEYSKNYGDMDSLAYSIQDENGNATPLKEGELKDILTREPGEDVKKGGYRVSISQDKISEKDSANYAIQNLTTSGRLTINPRKVNIVLDNNGIYNKNYGQKDNLTYSIQDEDGSTTPLKEGELEGIITRAPGEDVSEDGHRITYAVFASEDKISEKDSTNYNIQNLKTVKGSLTINQLPITVGIDNASRKYGEKNPVFSSSKFEFNGATDKDRVALIDEFWKSGVVIKCDATIDSPISDETHKYSITLENLEAASNFDVTVEPGTLTITQADAVLTPQVTKAVYGENIELNTEDATLGTVPTNLFAVQKTDEAGNVTGTYEVDATAGLDAGEYTLVLKPEAAAAYPNYAIQYTPVKFSIAKRAVEIVIEKNTHVYYGFTEEVLKAKLVNAYSFNAGVVSSDAVKKELGDVLTVTLGNKVNAGDNYEIKVNTTESKNFMISNGDATGKLVVDQLPVIIKAEANQSKVYGVKDSGYAKYEVLGINQEELGTSYTAESVKTELDDAFKDADGNVTVLEREPGEKAGSYAYRLVKDSTAYGNFNVTYQADKNVNYQIQKREVKINIPAEQHIYYGFTEAALQKRLTSYWFEAFETDLGITADNAKEELAGAVKVELKDEVNAGDTYTLTVDPGKAESENFMISNRDATGTLVVDQLPVTIKAAKNQGKIYSQVDKEKGFAGYEVVAFTEEEKAVLETTFDAAKIKEELDTTCKDKNGIVKVLKRKSGEDVGSYGFELVKEDKNYGNFVVSYVASDDITYQITPLSVDVTPKSAQSKTFGEKEPGNYTYDVSITDEGSAYSKDDVITELGKGIVARKAGENVGTYAYYLKDKDEDYLKEHDKVSNYKLNLNDGKFTVKSVKIDQIADITSRQGEFNVTTNLDTDRADSVSTMFKVTADFTGVEKTDVTGITYSDNITDYILTPEDLSFAGSSRTIQIEDAQYEKKGKDKKTYKWTGKLPAGTVLTVTVVGEILDENGNVTRVEDVSNAVQFKVAKADAGFTWTGTKQSSLGNGAGVNSYVDERSSLTLAPNEGIAGELVEILYGEGKNAASYSTMSTENGGITFKPVAKNADSRHQTQAVTANVVDILNLNCESKTQTFYVDDMAFPISSSAIQFENRGKEIKIQVPEGGTIKSVTIPGGTITLSGNVSNQFTLPVSFSGKNLIPTGSNISVTYVDEAGHEGTGNGTVSRSSVNTPITFRIRPELNANGYLNGQRGNTLIVSGVACACEPIRVTVAGMTQTINATQADTWSDSNGAWEVAFDMSRLPEGQDFTISAEYMDVNGTSYSMTAKYEAFVAPSSVKSPIYEAMTHISGMVEPGTAVALVVNGETSKYYEIDVDRFGRMSMDDVPMMFGGEDSFDIYVQDIAGNVSIQHYDIAEPGDPFEVTSQISPLGKYFYRAEQKLSDVYAATPISAKDFEESDTLELPLIMGMSYEVGKLTVAKNDTGIVVTSDIQLSENIDAEDYRVENEKLYVYRTRPTVDDLRDKKGEEFKYGDTIPLGENETIWIVDEKDMTILADDMEELELFNYEESKEYETYQEQ